MKAILIFLFFTFDFIYADECDNIMVEYLKSYNPLNFSNPVVNSGTGYNDFGKYDLCLDAKFKYYLNKITFNTTSDKVVPTFDAYVGLCIPEICYDDTILENWKGFLNKYTGIKKENIEVIKPLELNALYSKFDTICIIFTVFFLIFFLFGSGLIYYIIVLLGKEKKNTNIIEVNNNDNNVSISTGTNKQSINDSIVSRFNNNCIISNNNDRISIPVKTDNSRILEENKRTNYVIFDVIDTLFNGRRNWYLCTKLPKEKNIKLIYGIKAVAMFIVIFSSMITFYTSYPIPIRNPEGTMEYVRSFPWQFFFNNSVCYDILFFISAFYLSYKTINNSETSFLYSLKKILMKSLKYYPFYIIMFIIYWKFFIYLIDGPVGGYLFNNEIDSCNKNYPFILSMVPNLTLNFFSSEGTPYHCFLYSWFISNEFHFYIIGVILLYIYKKNYKVFYPIFIFLFLSFCSIEIFILYKYEYGVTFYEQHHKNHNNYIENYYTKLYTRITPFLIGLLCGIFYTNRHNSNSSNIITNINKSTLIQILLLSISYMIMLLIIFGVYFIYAQSHTEFVNNINLLFKVMINFLFRKIYVICLFLIMIPLLSGKLYYLGGYLSEDCFGYLNKITMAAYLISHLIIRYILLNARYQLYFDGWYFLFYGTATIALSYVIGFFMHFLFVLPFKNLKKYMFDIEISNEYDKLRDKE